MSAPPTIGGAGPQLTQDVLYQVTGHAHHRARQHQRHKRRWDCHIFHFVRLVYRNSSCNVLLPLRSTPAQAR